MELTYIANASLPGVKAHTHQILKMCEAFAKSGVKIELVLPFRLQRDERLKQLKDYWSYHGIRRRFKIIKLPSFDLIWLDLYTTKLSSLRFLIQAGSFTLSATLYALFKKAEVIYTRDLFFALVFGSLKFLHRKKLYYEAHIFNRLVGRLVDKGKVDGVIAINDKLKKIYMKIGVPEGKILVAPNAVDIRMFDLSYSKEEARKKLRLPMKGRIVGYVGHLRTMGMEKGIRELLEAFKRLKEQNKDLFLCFVGGLEDEILEYDKLARQKGLGKNVIFVGHRPPYEVPLYLKAFDVCVMPFPRVNYLYYTYYVLPLKLFEYMASKRPIVTTDLPAVREILNERNAVLVEPGNPEALAEGIENVLENEALANKIAKKAYEDVQAHSWERRAARILDFIRGGHSL
jgi:glycosyltransferase involved in cell wall biosynthesis